MRLFCQLFLYVVVAFAAGCTRRSGPAIADVSGKITVDGQPAADVMVTFEPTATDIPVNQRATSTGITDASGRYVLRGGGEQFSGALVGKHKVRLAKKSPELMDEVDPNYNVWTEMKKQKDFNQFPKKYNDSTELTFDVTAEGTDMADFDIMLKQ